MSQLTNKTILSPCLHTNNFRCLQVNLRQSKTAAAALSQIILENNLDIILIQEPYARHVNPTVLADIPNGSVAFHPLDHDHAFGAAIWSIPSLSDHPYIYFEISRQRPSVADCSVPAPSHKLPQASQIVTIRFRSLVLSGLSPPLDASSFTSESLVDSHISELVQLITSSARKEKMREAFFLTRHIP